MFKKYTVANWMEEQNIPCTAEAAKYMVGQNLTYEQACDIVRMIRQGMGFDEEHPGQHNEWRRGGDPYRQVIFQYAQLIEARKKRGSNWDRMLWIALDEEDQIACNDVSNDYFAYKFTMTKRLKEIFERVPKGYKVPKRKYGWF
jgi:hypothetical protein